MRLRPAQVAVHWICGVSVAMDLEMAMEERIQQGRQYLIDISGRDFGYDLQQWHDYLKHSHDGGYTWNRSIDLPLIMKEALKSEQWQRAVQTLEGGSA